MSMYVPLMIRTKVPHNFGIPVFEDNPVSGAQANGNGNMSLAMSGLEPRSVSHARMIDLDLSPDSRGPVPKTVAK